MINWYVIHGFHMLRFCLNDFAEKLFRLVDIWEMTFRWVDSYKLFRLVGPCGFVGIDCVKNAFPKSYFV